MAASDRLYELCCEVHDCEERIDRLSREVRDLAAFKRDALALVEDLEGDRLRGALPDFSEEVRGDMERLARSG